MATWTEERAALLNAATDMLKSARATLQEELPQLVSDNQEAIKMEKLATIFKNLKYAEYVNALQNPTQE